MHSRTVKEVEELINSDKLGVVSEFSKISLDKAIKKLELQNSLVAVKHHGQTYLVKRPTTDSSG